MDINLEGTATEWSQAEPRLRADGSEDQVLRPPLTQLREADLRHEQTMERQRLDGIGQEGRLRLLEQGATRVDERLGSMDEQLDNIAEGVSAPAGPKPAAVMEQFSIPQRSQ